MLEFTASQLDEIEAATFERYKRALASYFRTAFPDAPAVQDEAELQETIARAVEAGHRRGLRTSEGMARYVTLAVMLNEHLDEMPEIDQAFGFSGIDADLKVRILSDAVIDRLRAA